MIWFAASPRTGGGRSEYGARFRRRWNVSIRRATKLLKFARIPLPTLPRLRGRVGRGNLVMANMASSSDKAKLLRSLAIDRGASEAPRAGLRRFSVLVALGGGAAAVVIIAAVLLPQWRVDRLVDPAASQPSPASQAPAAVQ